LVGEAYASSLLQLEDAIKNEAKKQTKNICKRKNNKIGVNTPKTNPRSSNMNPNPKPKLNPPCVVASVVLLIYFWLELQRDPLQQQKLMFPCRGSALVTHSV